jgi:hypothetical protein
VTSVEQQQQQRKDLQISFTAEVNHLLEGKSRNVVTSRYTVRYQVLTSASMKFTVFWDMPPCSHVEVGRRFRGEYCLHHSPDDGGSTHLWNVGPPERIFQKTQNFSPYILLLFGTSVSVYELLNISRTSSNDFDAKWCSRMNTCSAPGHTMFKPTQLLCSCCEMRPSNHCDLDQIVTNKFGSLLHGYGSSSDSIFVL